MNYNEYMANIKAYRNGTLMQAAPTDALSDWHEKYFDTAVSALSKKMIADHVEHSEDADKFGKDFVSLVAILEEDGVSKQDIGKELEAVSKAAQSQADAAIKKLDSVQHSTDTLDGYQAAIKAYKEAHLEHGEWKKHKYIRIENGRYIYPEDVKKTSSTRNNQVPLNKQISNKISSTLSNLTPKKTSSAPTSPARTDQISGEKYVKNKLNDIATGFKNIAKSVQEYRSEKDAKLTKVSDEISKYVSKDSDSYNVLMDAAKKIASEDSKANISVSYDKETGRVSVKNDDAIYNPTTQRQSTSSTSGASAQADPDTVKKTETAEKNKKAFEESTKQLSPQEQYKKEQAEKKKADEDKYSDYGNSNQIKNAVKADVNQLLFELTGGRITQGEDAYKTYRDNSVKAHDEYIQEGKKQGINSVVLNNIYGYEQCKAVLESLEKYNEMGLISQESYNMGKGLYEYNLKKFKSLPAVKAYIETGKMPKEVPSEEKKVQHSDPRAAFYAAIADYKNQR